MKQEFSKDDPFLSTASNAFSLLKFEMSYVTLMDQECE